MLKIKENKKGTLEIFNLYFVEPEVIVWAQYLVVYQSKPVAAFRSAHKPYKLRIGGNIL